VEYTEDEYKTFADSKGVIRSRKSKIYRHYNGQQKAKDEQQQHHSKAGVNSCAPEGKAVPVPYVAPVVILLC